MAQKLTLHTHKTRMRLCAAVFRHELDSLQGGYIRDYETQGLGFLQVASKCNLLEKPLTQ